MTTATTPTIYEKINEAVQAIRRMRGGAQSQLMLGADGALWVVKFRNNPQGERVLANELLATRIAEAVGLTVPKSDVVEVSGTVGEVQHIGIRASVIRTAEGSEIIVPNGLLISGQVTNWTFSDRRRAVEVTVSVAAGSDLQRVTELLKNAAESLPGVAKEPAPQVYAGNFAAGAVAFQVRVWTDRYQDWAQVRSDLSVTLADVLRRENINFA